MGPAGCADPGGAPPGLFRRLLLPSFRIGNKNYNCYLVFWWLFEVYEGLGGSGGASRGLPQAPRGRPSTLFFRRERVGDHSGALQLLLAVPWFRIGNQNYNCYSVFWPVSGRTWPRDPLQRIGLDKLCRKHPELAPETNYKTVS